MARAGLSTEQAVGGPEYRSQKMMEVFADLQRSVSIYGVVFGGRTEDENWEGIVLKKCREMELGPGRTMKLARTCDPPTRSPTQTLRKFAFSVMLPTHLRGYSLASQTSIHLACYSERWTPGSSPDQKVP